MLLKPAGFMKAAAAGGGITDPNDVGAVVWLDMTDFTYQKQNIGGTTAVTATGQDVRYLVDRTSNGNDFETRAGSSAGVSASGSLTWNDAIFVPDASLAGLTSTMEVYALLSTSDATWCFVGKDGDGGTYLGVAQDTNGTSPHAGSFSAGPAAYSTNGSDESSPTRDGLHTVWSTGTNVIAGAYGVDLTTDTDLATKFLPLAYNTGFATTTASVLHFVVTPSLSTGDRTDLINWLKSEGGIA